MNVFNQLNLKSYVVLIFLIVPLFLFSCSQKLAPINSLTNAEKEEGWILLFDGNTSEGWRGYGKDHFPTGWEIVDGTLHMIGSGRGEAGSTEGGDIIYDKEFQNFTLKLEWKISEGGNSGIFYLGQETPEYDFI